jgi:hypothetical protein
VHVVCATGQPFEHRSRLGAIARFPQGDPVEIHNRIGRDDQAGYGVSAGSLASSMNDSKLARRKFRERQLNVPAANDVNL